MESILKKAIDGGYEKAKWITPRANPEIFFMDSLFWQALGNSCGWEPWVQTRNGIKVARLQEYEYRKRKNELGFSTIGDPLIEYVPTYIFYGSLFHEINLTSGWDAAIIYLTNLIKS